MRKMIISAAVIALAAFIGLAPAACSGSGTPDEPPPTTPGTEDQTLGEAAAASTEPAAPTTAALATPELPDGRHPGFIQSLASDSRSMTFDLVEWLVGDAATKAFHEDCNCSDEVDNDYYIRNNNPKLRTLAISPSVVVVVVGGPTGGDPNASEEIPLSHLADEWNGHLDSRMVWLTVSGGVVTKIEQQWVP